MTEFKAGESVSINDADSLHAGKTGTVEYQQADGRVWVQVQGFPLEKVSPENLLKLNR